MRRKFPVDPVLIQNGAIYAAEKITDGDDEEYLLLKKYTIQNYARMRSRKG
jgi:hypothetical protein